LDLLVGSLSTGFAGGGTGDWVAGVAETGTFVCPEDLPIERGNDYIPEGWTVETY
jgi:hypothetical protein